MGGAAVFAEYVYERSSAEFSDRVLLTDPDGLEKETGYGDYFADRGFRVIRYMDDLRLRLEYGDALCGGGKFLLITDGEQYVPYDVLRRFRRCEASLASLFPRLDAAAVRETPRIDYDLLALAYRRSFPDLRSRERTRAFIEKTVYGRENVKEYLFIKNRELHRQAAEAKDYRDWLRAAERKAAVDCMAAEFELEAETGDLHARFAGYILANYGKLSSVIDREGPVLVSRAMEYMGEHSERFAVVVMDGMSEFDWRVLSRGFDGVSYEKTGAFAMIPTTTSISRQCLLSNKYPRQLRDPWTLSWERAEFMECARGLGFAPGQIGYERGYDAGFGAFVRCAAVVINEVDDLVHAQMLGRPGMLHDVGALAKQGRLAGLVRRLLNRGFDVYITSDHGNTPCTGMGTLRSTGVEVETRSRRMLILKDFADKRRLMEQYGLVDFPKYFLDKEWDYLLCGTGRSFDTRGKEVMSHGGMTLDEAVVPFIKIKAVENNG